MQARLILSLGLLALVNAQQQQPAMALEDRDICLVSCGEGWCCVSGQKCIAGPLEGVDTPYGCEDEILGFHTTWGAYRGDGKEWPDRPSTTYTKPSEPTNPPPAPVESRYTSTTHPVVVFTPPGPPPPHPVPSSSTTSVLTYPVHEPESYSTVTPSSTSTPPIYIETTYSESSSITTISSYSVSYSNSTASFQETKTSDAANSAITTPPSSTPTNNSPQPATTTAVRAAAGQISVGNTAAAAAAAAGILASFMGFMML
ncbi:hypothetical protein V8F06_006470 [Rhypophila decipiens]